MVVTTPHFVQFHPVCSGIVCIVIKVIIEKSRGEVSQLEQDTIENVSSL